MKDKINQLTNQYSESKQRLQTFEQPGSLVESQNQQTGIVNELQSQLQSLRQALSERDQTEAFFEEAYNRAKKEIAVKEEKLNSLNSENEGAKTRSTKLEATVDHLRDQIDQLTAAKLEEKETEIKKIHQDHDFQRQLQNLEQERNEVENRLYRLEERISEATIQLNLILQPDKSKEEPDQSLENMDTDSQASRRLMESLTGTIEDKLVDKAEAVVLAFERVHTQYNMLEDEMRTLLQLQETTGRTSETVTS